MNQNIPNMVEGTIAKMREILDTNSVIGEPFTTDDGVTIIPISKISVGFTGGGSDFVSKNENKYENPFGGGVGGGMRITPIAFIVIKDGSVRMLPIATPANTTAERIVEMVPIVIDKVTDFVDSKLSKKEKKSAEKTVDAEKKEDIPQSEDSEAVE